MPGTRMWESNLLDRVAQTRVFCCEPLIPHIPHMSSCGAAAVARGGIERAFLWSKHGETTYDRRRHQSAKGSILLSELLAESGQEPCLDRSSRMKCRLKRTQHIAFLNRCSCDFRDERHPASDKYIPIYLSICIAYSALAIKFTLF